MNNENLVDPQKILEDNDRRWKQKYTGLLIQKWENGEIKNVREEYEIVVEGDVTEQWAEAFKHFNGLSKWRLCGKFYASVFKGNTTKIRIERSIPMEKFWIYKE